MRLFKILSKSLLVASFALASMTALASSDCAKSTGGRLTEKSVQESPRQKLIREAQEHMASVRQGKK